VLPSVPGTAETGARARADKRNATTVELAGRWREAHPGCAYLYELLRIPSGVSYSRFLSIAPALPGSANPSLTAHASLACTPGAPAENEKSMNHRTILVVDDEPQIRRVLRATLSINGYDVIEAKNGQEAIEIAVRERPDLILLDVNMPEMSGLETCSKMRLSFSTPIIMVTVRNSEQDKVRALDSGADDYVVKPFAIGELLARIRAALRRSSSLEPLPKIEAGELSIDLEKRSVDVRGARVHLTPKEFDVLRALVEQEGKPLTHKRLLQTVWGPDHAEETENLRVVINQLRKKIERDPGHPCYILTEPWLGYRFQLPSLASEKRARRKS
jgi:two-component system KDP operon response regulator KdpE